MKKKTRGTKKNSENSGIKEEFARHTNVLMEKMDSTVKTVAEQFGGVIKKIDKLTDNVVGLKNDMTIIKPAVEQHSRDLKEIKSELFSTKSEVSSIKMAVVDNSHRLDKIEKKLGSNLDNHEKRIEKIEEKVHT